MEIKVRTKEQQAIDNLKAIVNSKDKIIEIEPPIEDTAQILLDYITNLQEENKEWNMIFDGLSKRPYAHKYLEEKRKKLNNDKIVGLDSEMIYKDYYNLKERCEYLERSNNRREDTILGLRQEISDIEDENEKLKKENETLQAKLDLYVGTLHENNKLIKRIDKAIEYLPKIRKTSSYELDEKIDNLENILNGGDDNGNNR